MIIFRIVLLHLNNHIWIRHEYTIDIIENQILKAINHIKYIVIKYISKKKPCTL